MNTFDILKKLTDIGAVSGDENAIYDLLDEIFDGFETKKQLGGYCVTFGNSKAETHILLDAHIDRIGFRVTSITDDGFLTVDKCGGIDKRILPSQKVKIHGTKEISGVFCSTPPHLASGDKIPEISDMFIDTGLSKEKAREIISIGDGVSFDAPLRGMLGTVVSGGALDNRAGCCAVILAIMALQKCDVNARITAVFSNQEEIGERGAKMLGFSQAPDYAVCVDVSFAMALGESREKCGAMSKGPMIGFSPVLDKDLSRLCVENAQKADIPFQREIMSGTTSTNADTYAIANGGVKCALLSVPIRCMHTAVESCDLKDIEYTAALLADTVKSIAE